MGSGKKILSKLQTLEAVNPSLSYIQNRNPFNLEKLGISRKNLGYGLEKTGKAYWNRLELEATSKHVTASIIRHDGSCLIEASTKEWSIQKQLLKSSDTLAYVSLAKVFSQRCIKSGIFDFSFANESQNQKLKSFVEEITKNGLSPQEIQGGKRPWFRKNPPVLKL